VLTNEAPARFRDLEELGVRFDADRRGQLALGLEGGHRVRRVAHAGGSATGRRILRQLSADVVEHPDIDVLEGRRVTALLEAGDRVAGAQLDDGRLLAARAVILASGGAAALWSRTTNPPGSYGSGLLLAHAAGADLADLELVQFHPTAVTGIPGREGFLVSEAVRGEGATLIDAGGERFTDELAARDAVTAAVLARMRADGSSHVGLDLRPVDPDRFPSIFGLLRDAGVDPSREPVPVSPAAHYVMGGIATDLDGRSSLPGLLAVGECACSGLHGANRLASNSLSECFVFGARAAAAAAAVPAQQAPPPPPWRFDPPPGETRDRVWELAGPLRRAEDLRRLEEDPYPLARTIAACALARNESRGSHIREDAPALDPELDGVHLVQNPQGEIRHESWD
jgi:L-aspartate oxidase